MPLLTSLLFFVDPDQSDRIAYLHVGRVDRASLSQQTLMELLIQGIENKKKITKENCSDIEYWDRLTFDEDGDVTRIDWVVFGLRGKIDLQWLPSTVKYFQITFNALKGSVDLSHLPTKLESVFLDNNSFQGTLDLKALPGPLVTLSASRNQFSGSPCLVCLPPKLRVLMLAHNSFSGSLDLTSLAAALTYLNLASNQFEGHVHFGALPDSLSMLNLSENALLEGCVEENVSISTENTRISRVPVD